MTALEKLRGEVETLKRSVDNAKWWGRLHRAEVIEVHVRHLDSALKAVEDEQRWIPVEEGLPEKYKDVLIVCRSEIGIALGRLVVIGFDSLKWEIYGVDDPVPLIAVTHWRPLPEGPGEEARREGGAKK